MRRSIKQLLLGILSIPLFLVSCKKHLQGTGATGPEMVSQARVFVDSLNSSGYPVNYRASQPKKVRWDLAQLVPVGHTQGLLVPIVFDNALLMKANFVGNQLFHIDYLTQLLFYKDSAGKNTARVLTDFPDSTYFSDPTRPFTGIKFIEDWLGNPIQKLLFTPDGHIRHYVPMNKQPAVAEVIETCYEITGYNYSPDDPDDIYYWSEPGGCSVDYVDDGSDGSGGGGGSAGGGGGPSAGGTGISVAASFTVLSGNSVIKSIANYFQCFTNVGGSDHTYTVSVCVDQPDPGSRTPWAITSGGSSGSSQANNVVNTGHTFLVLTETYGSTTITRNVGFYPSGTVMPSSPSSPGQLNDDQNHYYNIGGTFPVDNGQFFNILNFITSTSTATYNLNTNNCTTFAINAMTEAGISLPATIGTWPGGAGDDPGDLGQDMKSANIPGMTLNVNPGYSQGNVGQCN